MNEEQKLIPDLIEVPFKEESNINIRGALVRPPEYRDQFNRITSIAIGTKKEEK